VNVAVWRMSSEDAPTLTEYVPASARQEDEGVSKEARSRVVRVKDKVSDSPGFNVLVFAKPRSSSAGLGMLFPGADR
jgi:hypothetical protein